MTSAGSVPPLGPVPPLPIRSLSEQKRLLEASFRTGKFADPPNKLSLAPGGDVLTRKHRVLINDLRTECARLAFDKTVVGDRAVMFEKRYRASKLEAGQLREQVTILQRRYEQVSHELEGAQSFMRKLDELFSGEKTAKMARAMSLPTSELEGAAWVQPSETPQFEFRNPFAPPSPG